MREERNSTDRSTSGSKKKNVAKNCPTRRATRARAHSGGDANEPLTRSDIPVLVQEVVSTLTVQGNSQVAGQVINSEEGSLSGITPQTSTLTGMFKTIVRKA